MDFFEKFHRRFGTWYERLFGTGNDAPELRPRAILNRIVAALEDKRQEGIDGQVYLPNVCTVKILVENDEQSQFIGTFLSPDELAQKVMERVGQHSYKLRGGFVLAIEEIPPAEGALPLEILCKFDTSIASPNPDHPQRVPGGPDKVISASDSPITGGRGAGLGLGESDGGTVPFVGSEASASVTVIEGDGSRREVSVGAGGLSVGRGKSVGNDLILEGDPMISKKHLKISFEGGRFLAYDEHSTNGTTVEGTPLTPGHGWPLADGDELRLGQTRLLFSTDADLKTAPAPKRAVNTPSLAGGVGSEASLRAQRAGGGQNAVETDSGGDSAIFRLISQSGQVHALASEMLLGRALTDDILITGDGVSAQHARVTVRGAHVYLEDLDTPGGTCVNDEKIRPGDARALKPGDRVAIGASILTLERGS